MEEEGSIVKSIHFPPTNLGIFESVVVNSDADLHGSLPRCLKASGRVSRLEKGACNCRPSGDHRDYHSFPIN